MNTNFVTASTKLRNDIFGKEFGIGTRNKDINVGDMQVTVQDIFEFVDKLNLIQENVVHILVRDLCVDVVEQFIRVA